MRLGNLPVPSWYMARTSSLMVGSSGTFAVVRQSADVAATASGPNEQHEQFGRADQRQCWPCADQRTDWPVPETVRQAGANGRHDPSPKAPQSQPWYTLVPAARIEHHHGFSDGETRTYGMS
jgi:hypothetical protein